MNQIELIVAISTIIFVLFNDYESKTNYVLNVCSSDEYVLNYYKNYLIKHKGDSGIDLVIPYNGTILPKSYLKIEHNATFVLTKLTKYKSYSYYLYAPLF